MSGTIAAEVFERRFDITVLFVGREYRLTQLGHVLVVVPQRNDRSQTEDNGSQ
jgi:hypothetical protein